LLTTNLYALPAISEKKEQTSAFGYESIESIEDGEVELLLELKPETRPGPKPISIPIDWNSILKFFAMGVGILFLFVFGFWIVNNYQKNSPISHTPKKEIEELKAMYAEDQKYIETLSNTLDGFSHDVSPSLKAEAIAFIENFFNSEEMLE